MQQLFQDDFERVASPPGNGWMVIAGSWSCASGHLVSGGASSNLILWRPLVDLSDVQVEVTRPIENQSGQAMDILLRSDGAGDQWVRVNWRWSDIEADNRIIVYVKDTPTHELSLGTFNSAGIRHDGARCQVACIGSHVYVWLDGVLFADLTQTAVPVGYYVGLKYAFSRPVADDFTLWDATPATLEITPSEVHALSSGNVLTLTNNYGGWVPGTPGSPTIAVDVGTIRQQWVTDEHTIGLVYDAPADVGVATFSDEDAGLSVAVTVSAAITTDVSAILDRIGILPAGETLVNYLKTITGGRSVSIPSVDFQRLVDLQLGVDWSLGPAALSAYFRTQAASSTSQEASIYEHVLLLAALLGNLTNAVNEILTDTGAMRGEGGDTLRDVVDDVRGNFGKTVSDVWAQIDALPDQQDLDLSSVLTAISNLRGDDSATVAAVLAAVLALPDVRGRGLWTLTDVYQHVSNESDILHGLLTAAREDILSVDSHLYGDTQAILTAIGLIQNNGDSSLWDAVNAILAGLGLASGGANSVWDKINTVLSGVNALADLLKRVPQTQYLPPVWPGASNVMKRESVPLAVGLTIPGPVDGVIVEVTSVPQHTPHYSFDGVLSHNHVGALAFRTDEDACEPPQNFGWSKGVYVPKTMVRAGSIVVRCKAGVSGSVTPWVIQPAVS